MLARLAVPLLLFTLLVIAAQWSMRRAARRAAPGADKER